MGQYHLKLILIFFTCYIIITVAYRHSNYHLCIKLNLRALRVCQNQTPDGVDPATREASFAAHGHRL